MTLSMIESMLVSIITLAPRRRHRDGVLENAIELRNTELENKEDLLAQLAEDEQRKKSRWQHILQADAQELANLLSSGIINGKTTEEKVIDIGGHAFRIGGIECMKYLQSMVEEIIGNKSRTTPTFQYLSIWWYGIGNWRSRWLEGEYLL